jgi:hypothetical protein
MPPLPQYAFMASLSILKKAQGHLYIYLIYLKARSVIQDAAEKLAIELIVFVIANFSAALCITSVFELLL